MPPSGGPDRQPAAAGVRAADRSQRQDFDEFVARTRLALDAALRAWLERRVAEASRRGSELEVVADAVRQLALRGGKRMRAVLLAAAYEACGGPPETEAVTFAGMSMEILQTYLLVHDDWMDGDATRRGGPSVPAMMHDRFAGSRADAMTVLAGDLAAAWAQRALLEIRLPPERVVPAAREFARMQEEVIHGQILDVVGVAADSREVEQVHLLKTSSYSVQGPVVMGACLAGAPESQVNALVEFARPLGVAFQLRDDILGVFGDEAATGKPCGSDIRSGKRTAVIVAGAEDEGSRRALSRALGRADASEDDVRAAIEGLRASGARERVEGRIAALVGASATALDRGGFTTRGRALLAQAIHALTEREC